MPNSVPSRPSPLSSCRNTGSAPLPCDRSQPEANIGTARRCVKERDDRIVIGRGSADEVEGPPPAGVGEEGAGASDQAADAGSRLAAGRLHPFGPASLEGPVDQEGAPDDVIARHQAPLAAVEAVVAVVAHDEVLPLGDGEGPEGVELDPHPPPVPVTYFP